LYGLVAAESVTRIETSVARSPTSFLGIKLNVVLYSLPASDSSSIATASNK
jgi:hypothetical protein